MYKLNNALAAFCRMTLMVMIPIMTVIIVIQVVLRYLIRAPLSWPEEFARYSLIAITLLGSALAVRESEHICLVFIRDRISRRLGPMFFIVLHCVLIVFFGFCAFVGFRLSISQWIENTAAMQIPMTIPTIMIPLGFTIMILFSFEMLLRNMSEVLHRRYTRDAHPQLLSLKG